MENSCLTVEKLLAELGDSPEAIARTLEAHGLQGIRNTVRFLNPVIRFLRGSVRIKHLDMDLTQSGALRLTLPDGSTLRFPLPAAVSEFLRLFNQGKYPALEMPVDKAEGILKEEEKRCGPI